MTTMLTKKQRAAHPRAQVQTLMRIAKRAEAKADHIESLMAERTYGYETTAQRCSGQTDVDRLRDRALAACNEAMRIVRDNPDAGWTLPQQRAAATWEVER